MKGSIYYQGDHLCDCEVFVTAPAPNTVVALPEDGDMVLRLANERPPEEPPPPPPDAHAQVVRNVVALLARDDRVRWPVAVQFDMAGGIRGMYQVQPLGQRTLHVCAEYDMDSAVRGAVGCQLCGTSWYELISALRPEQRGLRLALPVPHSVIDGGMRLFNICEKCGSRINAAEAEFQQERTMLREQLALLAFSQRQRAYAPRLETPT